MKWLVEVPSVPLMNDNMHENILFAVARVLSKNVTKLSSTEKIFVLFGLTTKDFSRNDLPSLFC